jgi:hypothetical protein
MVNIFLELCLPLKGRYEARSEKRVVLLLTLISFFSFFAILGHEPEWLHLEPFQQPFFVKGFFQRGFRTICPGWL